MPKDERKGRCEAALCYAYKWLVVVRGDQRITGPGLLGQVRYLVRKGGHWSPCFSYSFFLALVNSLT